VLLLFVSILADLILEKLFNLFITLGDLAPERVDTIGTRELMQTTNPCDHYFARLRNFLFRFPTIAMTKSS
jgi:hypothetical protein